MPKTDQFGNARDHAVIRLTWRARAAAPAFTWPVLAPGTAQHTKPQNFHYRTCTSATNSTKRKARRPATRPHLPRRDRLGGAGDGDDLRFGERHRRCSRWPPPAPAPGLALLPMLPAAAAGRASPPSRRATASSGRDDPSGGGGGRGSGGASCGSRGGVARARPPAPGLALVLLLL